MRHCIRLSQNEVKALADSLQFLSRKQQGSIERSYNIRLADLYTHLGHELGKTDSIGG